MPSPTSAERVIATLIDAGQSVAIAESLTAGGLGHALTMAPGSSKAFLGGIIAYTDDVKINVLGVDSALIEKFNAVSEEVSVAMADAAREKFGASWGISTTGIAGPGDYQGIAEGTVWISISGPINQSLQLHLDGGREAVRTGAISSAIGAFARILSQESD